MVDTTRDMGRLLRYLSDMASRVKGGKKLAAFLRKARSAARRSKVVEVGFFESARYSDGTPVAAVAAWNEFGTERNGGQHVPERPFFRNALVGADRDLLPIFKAGIDPKDMALDDRTARLIGEVMKTRIQQSITTLRTPPNAPSTIRRKGSSNPLIGETKTLEQSVDYEVKD